MFICCWRSHCNRLSGLVNCPVLQAREKVYRSLGGAGLGRAGQGSFRLGRAGQGSSRLGRAVLDRAGLG